MKTIRAIYEHGVFRPTDDVELQENTVVEFEPRPITPKEDSSTELKGIYAVLAERYDSGESDVAARHNEHQP